MKATDAPRNSRPLSGEDRERAARLALLFERCQENDQRAWSELVGRFQNLVMAVPRKMGLNREDSADVATAAFLALFRNLHRINSPICLPTWLAVTAAREALRLKRRSQRDPMSLESHELDAHPALILDPEAQAIRNVFGDKLRGVVARLPDRDQNLLNMIFMEEATYRDVSRRMSMPMGAIGPTRSRALRRLKAVCESEGMISRS